jgi:NAD(P)-dependent dehydrogenase (short-subunit alcohol dehydrogenase family)
MASLALTLCDDAVSGYVTGQAIVADGGMLLG